MSAEAKYRAALEQDPGDPVFADLAALLVSEERLHDAIIVALGGLSVNPEMHRGRLILAHALFRAGFIPFAAREIRVLVDAFPDNKHLTVLLERLLPGSGQGRVDSSATEQAGQETEVADVEFDIDVLKDL